MATAALTASPAMVPVVPTTALALTNVLYEKRDIIAYVTVNRPKVLNALNGPTWQDLQTAFEDAQNDPTVRGVILTGAGGIAFITGDAERSSRFGQSVLELIENLGGPVVAAITTPLRWAAAARRQWSSYFGLCAGTEDKKEGTAAFLEKRAAQFHGR